MSVSPSSWIIKMGTMESFQCNASPSSESFSSYTNDDHDHFGVDTILQTPHPSRLEVPTKVLKTSGWVFSKSFAFSNASTTPTNDDDDGHGMDVNPGQNMRSGCMGSNSSLMNQYHVVAERRRREKLNKKLVALSALVPTLKKMDKASVLGEAVKYVKQLQQRVKNLEEKAKLQNIESAVVVKSAQLLIDDDNDTKFLTTNGETTVNLLSKDAAFPEIQAKLSNKDVLLRIYCEKKPGLLERIFDEMEKFHLCINSTISLPFGNNDLAITVTAQVNEQVNSIPMKELVSKLMMVL